MNPNSQATLVRAGRPFPLGIRRRELIIFLILILGPPALAWVTTFVFGLPGTLGNEDPANPRGTHQFPLWIRGWHYLNLLLVVLLTRTGWSILADQPRLSWSATDPSSAEWLRFEPRGGEAESPQGLTRTRYWHALLAVGWAVSGWIYLGLVASTGERQHLVPLSWRVFPEAWHVFVQYSTFHLPLDPDGFYRYNSLQLLSYATVIFGFVPLILVTGLAISPQGEGRLRGLNRLFGNREAARSIHYLAILGYLAFVAVHLFFVVSYAIRLNGHHVVLGTDETGLPGWLIGGVGIGVIALIAFATRRLARPRPE